MNSAEISELASAYVNACSEVKDALKNQKNPHLGNNYADLSSVLDSVRPIFARHKLWLLQVPGACEVAPDGNSAILTLHGVLLHASGQQLTFATQVPFPAEFNKKTGQSRVTAQGLGSAITYGRRYQLAAVAGITQTDDDGNGSSGRYDEEPAKDSSELDALSAAMDSAVNKKSLDDLKAVRESVQATGNKKLLDKYVESRKAIKGDE